MLQLFACVGKGQEPNQLEQIRAQKAPDPFQEMESTSDHVEAHWPGINRVPVLRLLAELDSIVSEKGVDLIGHGFEPMLQELPGRLSVSRCNELSDSDLGRSVNAHKEIELAFSRLHLGDVPFRGLQANHCRAVDVEEPALRRCKHRLSAKGWGSA